MAEFDKRRVGFGVALAVLLLAVGFLRPTLMNMEQVSESSLGRGWAARTWFHVRGNASATPLQLTYLTPSEIKSAYKLPSTGGAGTTIAIVDAYDDPTVASDLQAFSSYFGLTPVNFTEHKMSSSISENGNWALEISLDTQWAHAIAPNATILLVEARSNSTADLMAAVSYAASQPNVVAVSMSWGGSEFSGETSYDSYFTTSGVTFFASSGDSGAGVIWPSSSPNVVGVGGTTLDLSSNGTFISETAWSGSGGGPSTVEAEPSYQKAYGVQGTNGYRGVPDVSYDADPNTGVLVYDSTPYEGQTGWWIAGGTSAGAPQWAAIQSLGLSAKNSNFYVDAKSASYSSYFRDITSGSNGLYNATVGYDLVTGLGSPLTTNFSPPAPASVTLNAPSSGSSLLPSTVSFAYTPVSVGSAIQNSSLWTNATGSWVQTATNATAVVNGTQNAMSYALNSLGTVIWNVEVFNSGGGAFASSNYTLTITNDIVVSASEDQWVTSGNSEQYLVRTSTGALYCVYFRKLNNNWAVYVRDSVDGGSTWVNETLISSLSSMSGYDNDFNSIAVDSNNNLHVVWEGKSSSYSNYQIWYSKYNGTVWSTPIVLSTYAGMSTSTQNSPAIAVDSNNYLHVVWYGLASGYSYEQIWEADYNGTGWSTPARLSTVAGMSSSPILKFPCIVVDSNNNLDVLFRGNATGYTNSEIWFTRRTGGTWSTPVMVSTYAGMNSTDQISPGLAIDSNNDVYAGWDGDATGYSTSQIWIAEYNGSWQTPVRVSTYAGMNGYNQGEPSIAVDTSGRVHVLWHGEATGYSDNDKVWYSNCTNGVWSTPQCLQPSSGLNNYPNVRWSNYPSFNIPYSRLDYVFTVGTSPYNVTFSYLTLPSPATVHLLLTEDPTQATYARGQSVTLTVDVLNQLSQPLNSTLTLTVTGPSSYYYFDFQTINVTANSVGEYSFAWNVPNVAGTYVVEVSLIPPQLTAYDAAWLKVV